MLTRLADWGGCQCSEALLATAGMGDSGLALFSLLHHHLTVVDGCDLLDNWPEDAAHTGKHTHLHPKRGQWHSAHSPQ